MMKRLVFMGTPAFALTILEALWERQEAGWQVVGVLTRADKPAGRGQQAAASPVKAFALAHDLPVQQPRTLRQPDPLTALAALQPDVIAVAAYGLILPQAVLDLPRDGCLNVHASLLPRHRGAAPVAGALLAGDVETGTTIMLMDAGMDTGPILSQAKLPIAPGETRGALMDRLAEQGAALLCATLPAWLAGAITPQAQDHSLATMTKPLTKAQGVIDWHLPAAQIARQVQAFQPWPGAFTSWQGRLLKINAAAPMPAPDLGAEPGQVMADASGVWVGCGGGALRLLEVQLEGKRSLDALTFTRGQRDFVGSLVGASLPLPPD